jgi:hypothetical protein
MSSGKRLGLERANYRAVLKRCTNYDRVEGAKMPTRVIFIDFNPDVTLAQMESFQKELLALADKITYKKSFCCGFNRPLATEAALDALARDVDVHVAQFAAIWEFGSYDDLTRFVGESQHRNFASQIATSVVRRRYVVNI